MNGRCSSFVRAGGDGPRDGTLFASSSVPAFKAGETVTFGVPWLSEHHELMLTFPLDGLAEVNRAVRAALLRCPLVVADRIRREVEQGEQRWHG